MSQIDVDSQTTVLLGRLSEYAKSTHQSVLYAALRLMEDVLIAQTRGHMPVVIAKISKSALKFQVANSQYKIKG